MVHYKASQLITRAMKIANIENTSFIDSTENRENINDAYIELYQKMIDCGDTYFLKYFTPIFEDGRCKLPSDFYQLSQVKDSKGNGVLRRQRNSSKVQRCYDIRKGSFEEEEHLFRVELDGDIVYYRNAVFDNIEESETDEGEFKISAEVILSDKIDLPEEIELIGTAKTMEEELEEEYEGYDIYEVINPEGVYGITYGMFRCVRGGSYLINYNNADIGEVEYYPEPKTLDVEGSGDVDINLPSNPFYQAMLYRLAIYYKVRMNEDTSLLEREYDKAMFNFVDTMQIDDYEYPQMRDVYDTHAYINN